MLGNEVNNVKTTINLTFTEIRYFNPVNEETKSMKVQGKLTVKKCRTVIPEGSIYIRKIVEEISFEVDTNELLALRLDEQPLEEQNN